MNSQPTKRSIILSLSNYGKSSQRLLFIEIIIIVITIIIIVITVIIIVITVITITIITIVSNVICDQRQYQQFINNPIYVFVQNRKCHALDFNGNILLTEC